MYNSLRVHGTCTISYGLLWPSGLHMLCDIPEHFLCVYNMYYIQCICLCSSNHCHTRLQVKKFYRKACLSVHPDKVSTALVYISCQNVMYQAHIIYIYNMCLITVYTQLSSTLTVINQLLTVYTQLSLCIHSYQSVINCVYTVNNVCML